MQINNSLHNYSSNTYKNNSNQRQANPSFGMNTQGLKEAAQKGFNWFGDKCNVSGNGSLTRSMFFIVGTCFMLGGRFFESRDKDEKREVLTRDIPGVAIASGGAHMLNNAVARLVTDKTGVPIATLEKGTKPSVFRTAFASQKQVVDWFSGFKTAQEPLINLAKNVTKHGGNINKVMKKFGFENEFKAITTETNNAKIVEMLEKAKDTEAFKELEKMLRNVSDKNDVVEFAKSTHAGVKISCILFSAALLGYFLPRLNIITTKKKYQNNPEEAPKVPQRPEPLAIFSNGVYLHRPSARNTFKSFLM